MSKKKRKKAAQKRQGFSLSSLPWRRLRRPLIILGSLVVVAGGVILVANPFASPPTAIDADGLEVTVGVIDTPGASPEQGKPAPNFVLADYDGNAVRLSDFKGKNVYVNFWATWCPPCEREMPDIVRTQEEFPDDLVVIAINRGEGTGRAKQWSDARGHTGKILFLTDPREDVTREYRVRGMPTNVFIDRNGIIRRYFPSALTRERMRESVEFLLSLPGPDDLANPASEPGAQSPP